MTGSKKKDGIHAGNGSVVVGGNVSGSNIVVGNNNVVSNKISQLEAQYEIIYHAVDQSEALTSTEKEDVKAELQDTQTELANPEPNETFLARRFRNVKRMAPEIVEVAFETLKNPISGVAEVIKRVAKKAAEESNS